MPYQQFELKNWKEWGDLVKDWSRENAPRPTDPTAFKQLLDDRNVEATFDPADWDAIVYYDYAARIVHIKVPPKGMIDQAEQELQKGAPYMLPPFYATDMKDPTLKESTVDFHLRFHSKRVGEYTVRFCG